MLKRAKMGVLHRKKVLLSHKNVIIGLQYKYTIKQTKHQVQKVERIVHYFLISR